MLTAAEYEERYGPNPRSVIFLLVSAVFVGVFLWPGPDIPILVRVLGLALFGGGSVIMLLLMFSRKTALRVDSSGITLGGSPPRYRATTAFVPWRDVVAVVLWRQRMAPGARMDYVGVQRKKGLPPLPGPGTGRLGQRTASVIIPHIPGEVTVASRPVNGWSLDPASLESSVKRVAPHVSVIDAR
ncbi:hypothetical protein [Haloechinothrix salitolerans]|uniref:PH domain-containing protein n=1 Tax=Haloechinothrix salitolerans TaxID=926830 RepID=A0ABW2C386_9PSEU